MSIKNDIIKVTENLRSIVNAPVGNISAIFSMILIFLSFCNFNIVSGEFSFSLTANPRWIMLLIGGGFLLICVVGLMLTREDRKINKKMKIEDGLSVKFRQTTVNIRVGKIQDTSGLNQSAGVVLPANTTFVDDCITDKNSALGAFFLEHYLGKTSEIIQVVQQQLKNSKYLQSEDGTYALGATIVLPSPYDIPVKILITASTARKEDTGIRAEPSSICECIRQVFLITSDKKISRIWMPILGSGHGGLDINAALLFLLFAIRHYTRYYYHVKSVDIIVTENDAKRLKDIYRLQYLTFLEEECK